MSLVRLTAPAALPVTPAELAEHLRLAIAAPETEQSAELTRLIESATRALEIRLDRALLAQVWRWILDRARPPLALPLQPLISVEAVRIAGPAASNLWDGWRVLTGGFETRIDAAPGHAWPVIPAGGHLEIDFTAGYGALPEDLPADLRQAVRMLAAHFHENREAVAEAGAPIPLGVASLIAPYRPIRL